MKKSGKVVSGVPVFGTVFAVDPTAVRILRKIEKRLLDLNKTEAVRILYEESAQGLCLQDDIGSSYSLKFEETAVEGRFILRIGDSLRAAREEDVANNITAMILRGSGWQDRQGRIHEEPYGRKKGERLVKPPAVWKRELRLGMVPRWTFV